ncbi:MAG: hypothetical protein Q4Q17_01575 [Tissierellia bacterium]|nr:hypothetical protein [Tissierellia bacterium]
MIKFLFVAYGILLLVATIYNLLMHRHNPWVWLSSGMNFLGIGFGTVFYVQRTLLWGSLSIFCLSLGPLLYGAFQNKIIHWYHHLVRFLFHGFLVGLLFHS